MTLASSGSSPTLPAVVGRYRAWFLLTIDKTKEPLKNLVKFTNDYKLKDDLTKLIEVIQRKQETDLLQKFAHIFQVVWDHPKQKPGAYEQLFTTNNIKYELGDLVVIRADIVHLMDKTSLTFDLVIPVDARTETHLLEFKKYLNNFGSVIEVRVHSHFPEAPYLSNGYISIEEARLGLPMALPESLYLTRQSPGDNPWG